MSKFFFDGNAQLYQSLLAKILEEHHAIPDMSVHFLEHVTLEGLWEGFNKFLFFTEVEISLDFCGLLDIVHDSGFCLVGELGLLLDMVENLEVTVFGGFVGTDFLDDTSDTIDVIS